MIDWLSFNFKYDGPRVGSVMLKKDYLKDGYEELPPRPHMLEGSYSSKISVQSIGGVMYISGNPVKFLTGQNVAGTNDIKRLTILTYEAVLKALNLPDCLVARRQLNKGFTCLTRVDCTFMYRVGSDDDVIAWLEAMERACNVRYRGRGHFDQGMCSLMFGLGATDSGKQKASRRSTFKFYNKFKEMSVHKPTCDVEFRDRLQNDVLGCVRGEALYRGIELKKFGKDTVRKWTGSTCYELHKYWIDKMEITEGVALKSEKEQNLPKKLQAIYHIWRSGVDCRALYPRNTFYRHRKAMMEHGIDITMPLIVSDDPVQVIPVLKVLEATPISETAHEAIFWKLAA